MSGINQTQLIPLGVSTVTLGSLNSGLVAADVKVALKGTQVDMLAAITGKTPNSTYNTGMSCEIDFTLAQTGYDLIAGFFAQATLVSNSSGSAVNFGQPAGTLQASAALTITPQTGPFANWVFTAAAVVPEGTLTIGYSEKQSTYAVKLKVLASNPTSATNTLGITFGPSSVTQAGGFSVVSTVPANGATNTPLTGNIYQVNFSNALNISTVNSSSFVVTPVSGNQIQGTISFVGSPASGVFFTPNSAVTSGTTLYGIVTSNVKDTYGNNLTLGYLSTFVP
jgi:hypothetical protein